MWINLSKGELDDPKGITRDVSETGHWGNGDYEIQISNDEQENMMNSWNINELISWLLSGDIAIQFQFL